MKEIFSAEDEYGIIQLELFEEGKNYHLAVTDKIMGTRGEMHYSKSPSFEVLNSQFNHSNNNGVGGETDSLSWANYYDSRIKSILGDEIMHIEVFPATMFLDNVVKSLKTKNQYNPLNEPEIMKTRK